MDKNDQVDNSPEEVVEAVEDNVEEVVEETVEEPEESEDSIEVSGSERISELEQQLGSLKRQKTQLEKKVNSKDTQESEKPVTKDPLSREEAILFAQGSTEDEVDTLHKIAALEGVSLTEAKKSEVFEAFVEAKAKKQKSDDASVGASKGSGAVKKVKSVSDVSLSKEEHMALAKRKMGQ